VESEDVPVMCKEQKGSYEYLGLILYNRHKFCFQIALLDETPKQSTCLLKNQSISTPTEVQFLVLLHALKRQSCECKGRGMEWNGME
jgi:hypothetical protein